MMAALRARRLGKNVLLLERNNSLGKKMRISGKGRCNLTNAGDLQDFLENFSPTREFLRSAFNTFFNDDLIEFLKKQEVEVKTERGGRVFPVSDRSSAVLYALKHSVDSAGVKVLYSVRVKHIQYKGDLFNVALDDARSFSAKKVIIATGGLSYPLTGSTGDGYGMAESLGHTVVPLRPGLVPLETKERWVKDCSGLGLKNVRLTIVTGKKPSISEVGEMLFTHFGISGPLVLTSSGVVVDLLNKQKKPVELLIDLKPGLSNTQLDQRLLRDLTKHGVKIFRTVLKELLPGKLIDVFLKISHIDGGKKASQISAQERKMLCGLLKGLPLIIMKSRPMSEAIITRGGVSTKEINPRTMESKVISGLYFCGEVIDVDANTGGYNMQAAFSTGFLAGESASQAIAKNSVGRIAS